MQSKRFTDKLTAAAYHEAGHAVMCWQAKLEIKSITISHDDPFAGQVMHHNPFRGAMLGITHPDRARLNVERIVMVCLAGPLAQKKYALADTRDDQGGALDFDTAADVALRFYGSKTTAAAYLKFAEAWVKQKLDDPAIWTAVERLADALVRQRRLSGREAKSIILEGIRPG